jgi:ribosomal-protein-alanine N-acetyltransferase
VYTPFFETFPTLQTDRLILRKITSADADSLYAFLSDSRVTETMDVAPMENREEAERLISWLNERFAANVGIRWGITQKDEDVVIGTGGFNWLDERGRRGEIGYDIAPAHWGHGLATEATGAIIRAGFEHLDLNRIEATTNLHNVASMKVLHKLGFTEEGIVREYGFWRGEFHDLRLFSLLRREWQG